jgi:peptide methionine sulfoxide reductase MsrA
MVTFDKSTLTYEALLDHFFNGHRPMSDACMSKQYMKGVWWHSEAQETAVLAKVAALEAAAGGAKVVSHYGSVGTNLYRAEEYHQRYFEKNR